jgi:hypothetical protein
MLNPGRRVPLVTGAAAIDPDPIETAAVEEAKIVVADRACDAPVIEGAADPNQNCRGWAFDQAARLGVVGILAGGNGESAGRWYSRWHNETTSVAMAALIVSAGKFLAANQ